MKPSSGVKPPIPSMMRSPFSRELTRTVRRDRARAHSAASASPESIRGLREPPPCGGTRSGKLFSLLERRSRQAGRVHAGQPHPGELQAAAQQGGKVRITLDKAKVQGALGDAILHRLRIADE